MPKRRKNKKPRPEQRNITAIPRTANQGKYIEEIRKSSITICIGLPGTGKTFLAVSEAVKAIKAQEVKKDYHIKTSGRSGRNTRIPTRKNRG